MPVSPVAFFSFALIISLVYNDISGRHLLFSTFLIVCLNGFYNLLSGIFFEVPNDMLRLITIATGY